MFVTEECVKTFSIKSVEMTENSFIDFKTMEKSVRERTEKYVHITKLHGWETLAKIKNKI